MVARKKILWSVILLLPIALLMLCVVLVTFTGLRDDWRVKVLASRWDDGFWGLSWVETLKVVRPGSGFWISTTKSDGINVYDPEIHFTHPFASEQDLAAAREIYGRRCAACHGAEAGGTAAGPALASAVLPRAFSDLATFRLIRDGLPGTAMPANDLPWEERWQLVAYVSSIKGKGTSAVVQPIATEIDVGEALLEDAGAHPQNWVTYSGTYDGRRFSSLQQINRDNVDQLQVRWIHHMPGDFEKPQTNPLVYNGIMFFTSPPATVIAADAATGKLLWKYQYRVPADFKSCCGIANRGVALHGNQVVFATIDARLIALDARTGKVNWNREVADYRQGIAITAAPLAVNDLIITGVAGGEFAARGFIAAYRATDGEPAWRFETIPEEGAPGNETWAGESWKLGGAPTWMTGSFDPSSDTVYWGVGNPSPEFNGDVRAGDNLYTESVVALDAANGSLKWHFQFTPADVHGWDACQVPVLVDNPTGPEGSKVLAWPNRNGFFYSIDATNGRFLGGREFARQNWASGLDENGRPIRNPGTLPTESGAVVWPSADGVTIWWPPALHPGLDLLYVPVIEKPGTFVLNRGGQEASEGELNMGGASLSDGQPYLSATRALNAHTGEVVWERRWTDMTEQYAENGGFLATGGGLLFGSDRTKFWALDARNGEVLWSFDVGLPIVTAPITYSVDGRQHVALAAGKVMLAFALPDGSP